MQAHCGALDAQMVIAGFARFGSSKLPTRTNIKCGRASASLNKGVPQVEQNRRCIRLPLSAMLVKSQSPSAGTLLAPGKYDITVSVTDAASDGPRFG